MTPITMKRHVRGHKEPIETIIEVIPLEKLRLDRTNVRFRHISRERDSQLSDEEIEELIWQEPDTKVLYNLIIGSGGLTEKPFVDENNVVKEGNRRLVCLRQIVRDIKSKKIQPSVPLERFTKVECEIPIDGIAPLDMEILLARWHVKDKKPWAKLNQASHLYDMKERRGLSFDEIAREVGLSKGKVFQACKSFEWTTEYMRTYKVKDPTCWSFFEELYKKKELRSWVMDDRLNLEKFFKWVCDKKFPMAIDVRKLPLILFNIDKQLSRDVTRFFTSKEGNVPNSMQKLAHHDPSLSSDFFKVVKRVRQRLDKMSHEDLTEVKKMPAKKKALISLRDKINEITK